MPSQPRWFCQVIEGRMTRSRVITIKGDGKYMRVEVYPTAKVEGEPVDEWDMPVIPDYDNMARTAVRQTDFTGCPEPEPEVDIRIHRLKEPDRWMWQIYLGDPQHSIPYLVEYGMSFVGEDEAKAEAEKEVPAAIEKFRTDRLPNILTYRYTPPEGDTK